MLDSFLRSVTKDSYGPLSYLQPNGTKLPNPVVVEKFHDSFSVLGWGKMPDLLADRGKTNALFYHQIQSRLKSPERWKDFLRSPDALTFRKAAASIPQSGNVSAMLNELTEIFPVPTGYLGLVDEAVFKSLDVKTTLTSAQLVLTENGGNLTSEMLAGLLAQKQSFYPVCEFFHEEKMPVANVMGRAVTDYAMWKNQNVARFLPFEFHCHFTLTESTLAKLNTNSLALPKTASIATLQAGTSWDFPLIELVLSQDAFQKRIGYSEAVWMTGFSPEKLQKTILTAAWIAAFVKYQVRELKLNSVDLRFAFNPQATSPQESLILADCLAIDDLHLEKEGHPLHVDASLDYYQKTSWFESVVRAQKQAEQHGLAEWKRLCAEPSPWLEPKVKQSLEKIASEIAHVFKS